MEKKNKYLGSLTKLNKIFNHEFNVISFFQSDLAKFKIFLEVMKNYSEDKKISIEQIIELIPSAIASRAHKLNIITDATRRGYFLKITAPWDERIKIISPSDLLIKEFDNFLKKIT